ncbi:MAG: hypothetical protein F4Z17_01790 [Acidimicrobiia bacterium]|nr:hypothetical protein [Acidimicrobiia bacterium]
MTDPTPQAVAEALSRLGLTGPAFDVAALAEALARWDEAGQDLDRLLSRHEMDAPAANPTSFSPKW